MLFYCIILYYIVLHCIILYYIVLYCIILYYIVLYCIIYVGPLFRILGCNYKHNFLSPWEFASVQLYSTVRQVL